MSTEFDDELNALRERQEKLRRLIALREEVGQLELKAMTGTVARSIVKLISEEVCAAMPHATLYRMLSRERVETIARPRQVVFYLARQLTNLTYQSIGEIFGRDHGTVMHGERAIRDLKDTERPFNDLVEQIRLRCVSRINQPKTEPSTL